MSEMPEVALWRAVIAQAIEDATARSISEADLQNIPDSKKRHARRLAAGLKLHERSQARAWLLNNSKEFREVCSLALLDPDAVRDRAQKMSRDNWPPTKRPMEVPELEAA